VSTAIATFPAAPLDRTARIVTRGMWVLTVVFVLIAGGLLFAGVALTGVLLLLTAVILAALMWHLGRLRPTEYVVEDAGLAVHRRGVSPKRFDGVSRNGRHGRLGARVAGDGGGYGYLGRFRAEGRTVHAFVTDRARVVLLDVGDVGLAVSPDDPDAFLAEVERGT
jgi:hypothetical protein